MIVEHFRLGKLWFNLNINSRVIVIVIFLLSLSLGSFTSCKEPSTGPETESRDSLVLKFKDSDLTSATLSLHTVGVTLPATLFLTRNQDTVQSFSLHRADTTLKDSLLTPSTTYIWQAVLAKSTLKSKPVTGRTMDTTSANFTWRTWEFGDYGSSVFYDVAIINENDIWAVGEIKLDDSLYTDAGIIGALHWDGLKWTPVVINSWTGTGYHGLNIKSIEIIDDQIYMATPGSLLKYTPDSVYQLAYFPKPYPEVFTHQISDMWGDSDDNIWMVGANGGIFHYTGSEKWEDHSIQTDVFLGQVSNMVNGRLFTSGGNWNYDKTMIYQILPFPSKQVNFPPDSGPISVSQTNRGDLWLGALNGIFIGKNQNDQISWQKIGSLPTKAIYIHQPNDVFGASIQYIWHFNGVRITTPWKGNEPVWINKIQVQENLLVAVGYLYEKQKAIVLIGKRQNQ